MSALRAGYGETVIPPPPGTDLTGFGFYLDRKAEKVLDELKVRALHLDDRRERLLIISCDLLGLTVDRSDGIRSYIGAAIGAPGDYACYFAPEFYALFPFSPAIESILLRESRNVLAGL